MATANLVFRVLDEDNSEKLGFKEFLQAIDLVRARWVRWRARSGPGPCIIVSTLSKADM